MAVPADYDLPFQFPLGFRPSSLNLTQVILILCVLLVLVPESKWKRTLSYALARPVGRTILAHPLILWCAYFWKAEGWLTLAS